MNQDSRRQYDYDTSKDLKVVEALARVWSPPWWGEPVANGKGNCIEAALLAASVLSRLWIEREIVVCRVRAWGPHPVMIGYGDCGSYAESTPGMLAGHAVVVGHGWLLDTAAPQLNAPGPTVALPTGSGVWAIEEITYTWAPGLGDEIDRCCVRRGHDTHAGRMAAAVRREVGPLRRPRSYSID